MIQNEKILASVAKPWLKYYGEKEKQDVLPLCTMYEYLKEVALEKANLTAINYYGKKYTFKWLMDEIDRTADAFVGLGVKKGDIVSFLSVATPNTICAIYALNKIGVTANLIDPRMDVAFITKMVKNAESKIMLCIDAAFIKASEAAKNAGVEKLYVLKVGEGMPWIKKTLINKKLKKFVTYSEKVHNWTEFMEYAKVGKAELIENGGDEIAAIAYTGGTTGFPKGVMFTNTSINAVSYNFRKSNFYHEDGHTFLGIIPVFTSYGLACGLHMPLCFGLGLIPIPQFKPEKFGAIVKKYRPNHMISTPAFYEMLMNSKEMKNMNLEFVITLGSGGDTMNEGLEEKFIKFMQEHNMKFPLAQGYGLSEMSSAVTFCGHYYSKRGSVGIPAITTNCGIFAPDTGDELPIGEIGEVCVNGPNMMKGYFGQPEETANVIRTHKDGVKWIHSGDLGYIDEDGFLYIVGRLKRMITRFDGHKVFPVNIESLVSMREDVKNCCVVGVKDRARSQGEYPLVLVTLYGDDELDEGKCQEIFDECNEKLEERGRPVGVIPVKEIPLTLMGKNDYRAMEKQYRDYDYTKLHKNIKK